MSELKEEAPCQTFEIATFIGTPLRLYVTTEVYGLALLCDNTLQGYRLLTLHVWID